MGRAWSKAEWHADGIMYMYIGMEYAEYSERYRYCWHDGISI